MFFKVRQDFDLKIKHYCSIVNHSLIIKILLSLLELHLDIHRYDGKIELNSGERNQGYLLH